MRLVVCGLSAVLLSGCSWLGMGGHSSSSYGNSGVYGANCGGGYAGGMNTAGYGAQGYSGGCGGAGGYSVAGMGAGYGAGAGMGAGFGQGAGYGAGSGYGAGYGAGAGMGAGFGQGAGYGAGSGYGAGYGAGSGFGQGGAGMGAGYGAGAGYGVGGDPRVGFGGAYGTGIYGQGGALGGGAYGAGGYGANGVTTLGANAPYGAAVAGVGGTQYAGSGYTTGGAYGGNVTTVQGSPIYVPQPYPSYYGVPQLRAVGGGFGGAMPFGLEAGVGTNFFVDGDFVTAKDAGIATGGTLHVSATDAISYKDAFDKGVGYDLATTYDLNQSTTLLGRIGYNKADGQRLKIGSVNDSSTTEDLYAEFSDLEQVTLEGGVRKYVGGWNNPVSGFRPYVGATAGFTHTDSITIAQEAGALLPVGSNVQQYVAGGWNPTASGVIGAEWQAGARTALGIETGLRWSDNLNTLSKTDDTFSVPVRLRGRVSF